MKFPFSTLSRDPVPISTPSPELPETRLPSGGTTNTGVTVPLLPVGLFAWPVALSTYMASGEPQARWREISQSGRLSTIERMRFLPWAG